MLYHKVRLSNCAIRVLSSDTPTSAPLPRANPPPTSPTAYCQCPAAKASASAPSRGAATAAYPAQNAHSAPAPPATMSAPTQAQPPLALVYMVIWLPSRAPSPWLPPSPRLLRTLQASAKRRLRSSRNNVSPPSPPTFGRCSELSFDLHTFSRRPYFSPLPAELQLLAIGQTKRRCKSNSDIAT
jgi:hypothetical protein